MARNRLFTINKSDREGFKKAYVPTNKDLSHAARKIGRGVRKVLWEIRRF